MNPVLFDKEKIANDPVKGFREQCDDVFKSINATIGVNLGAKNAKDIMRFTMTAPGTSNVELTIGGPQFRTKNTAVYKVSENDIIDPDKFKLLANDRYMSEIYGSMLDMFNGTSMDYVDRMNDMVEHIANNEFDGEDYEVLASFAEYYAYDVVYKGDEAAVSFIDSKCSAVENKFRTTNTFEQSSIYLPYFAASSGDYSEHADYAASYANSQSIDSSLCRKYLMWRDYDICGMDADIHDETFETGLRRYVDLPQNANVDVDTLKTVYKIHNYITNEAKANVCALDSGTSWGVLDIDVPAVDSLHRMDPSMIMSRSKESGTFYVKGNNQKLTTFDKFNVDADKYPCLAHMVSEGTFTDEFKNKLYGKDKDKTDISLDAVEMGCFDYMCKSDKQFADKVDAIWKGYVTSFGYSTTNDFINGEFRDVTIDPVRVMSDSIGVGGRNNMFTIGAIVKAYTSEDFATPSQAGKTRFESVADKYQTYVSSMDAIRANGQYVSDLTTEFNRNMSYIHKSCVDAKQNENQEDAQTMYQSATVSMMGMIGYDACTVKQLSDVSSDQVYIPYNVADYNCLKLLSQVVHRDVSLNESIASYGDASKHDNIDVNDANSFVNVVDNLANSLKRQVKLGKNTDGKPIDVVTLRKDLEFVRDKMHEKFDTPVSSEYKDLLDSFIDKSCGHSGHSGIVSVGISREELKAAEAEMIGVSK